jgi:hypothetical protein
MNEREAFKEKLRSLSFSTGGKPKKVTVDHHDHHTMEVTEHWNDQVDVAMKPETIHLTAE